MRSDCHQDGWRRALASLLATLLASTVLMASAQQRLTVVVSLHPVFDLTRAVAGEHAEVLRILPPGASPHTFDPTPRDVARVLGADLIVMVGGLDLWLRDLVEASGSRAEVLEVIALPEVQQVLREAFPDLVAVDAGGAVVGFNPHVWLDPIAMIPFAHAIAAELGAFDPDHADAYRTNAAALEQELLALHAELHELLASVAGAAFVPFHDAWPYFAARYGLDLVIEIEPFPGREPSPAYLRTALREIRDSGAKVVFSEVQLSRRAAEVVAADAGVGLAELDPLGGVDGRERYHDMMRFNASTIVEALR